MQDRDLYLSYKELIQKGWFDQKREELETLLKVLTTEQQLSVDESRRLLKLASDKHVEDTTPLPR
jgi:hypothetical protein